MKTVARIVVFALCAVLILGSALAAPEADGRARVDALLDAMTLDQKISQMIMPALRAWDGEKLTDLSAQPKLAEALRRHQYGGVILFGSNIADTAQTVRLIDDLQRNNAESDPAALPYLISADQEGGYVARLSMGTRGTGSMAIGATGEAAEANARATGQVFGEELEALGINVNLGPCIDVISDLADLGMSTRVFSDDPQVAARLGLAFAAGVGQSNVVTCFKHFPGAGDGSDYPTAIRLTPDQLAENGLAAFRAVVEGGARFVLLSDNLPVDAARFQDADAIVCAYMSSGFGVDPTARTGPAGTVGAYNANVPAALCAIFGDGNMPGRLPVAIPAMAADSDGKWAYGDQILYERGYSAPDRAH